MSKIWCGASKTFKQLRADLPAEVPAGRRWVVAWLMPWPALPKQGEDKRE